LQRGDAVPNSGQRADSRVLKHQTAGASTGPVPDLLRLKHHDAQVRTELAHVVRGGQASESCASDGNVHM
jgi:hypothetical protein